MTCTAWGRIPVHPLDLRDPPTLAVAGANAPNVSSFAWELPSGHIATLSTAYLIGDHGKLTAFRSQVEHIQEYSAVQDDVPCNSLRGSSAWMPNGAHNYASYKDDGAPPTQDSYRARNTPVQQFTAISHHLCSSTVQYLVNMQYRQKYCAVAVQCRTVRKDIRRARPGGQTGQARCMRARCTTTMQKICIIMAAK